MIKIPLLNSPSQTFNITIDNIEYSLLVTYNTREETWSMNITGDGYTINGVNLVGGVDILSHYPITLKNVYMINVSGITVDATLDNLGTEVVLLVATDEEMEEVIALGEAI